MRIKVHNQCIYISKYRQSVVVYKATCKCCVKFCIDNTQNKVKDRICAHLNETRNLARKGFKSDSFASHVTSHFITNDPLLCKEIRSVFKSINEPKKRTKIVLRRRRLWELENKKEKTE